MATVVMLVALRLSLGCHFLYEGTWKITNPEFTAEPFLTQAKGPFARLFYAMVPDIDGRQRLFAKDDKDQIVPSDQYFADRWVKYREQFVAYYGLNDDQKAESQHVYELHEKALNNYLAENRGDMIAYHQSLDDFAAARYGIYPDGSTKPVHNDGMPFQQKRFWDKQQELRGKVNGWLAGIEKIEHSYHASLRDVLDEKQAAIGSMASWNPFEWSRMEQVNFAVTYGLTAIGLCLMLGFCTRLACLGGGAFMIFVVLTQPSWPSIYPPAPPVVGHALLINKDFIEMISLFTLATTAVGRWGGLDYFLYYFFGRRFERCCGGSNPAS